MVKYRYIREERVRRYAKAAGIVGIPLIFVLFMLLVELNAITITGHSGDVVCAGTYEEPCIAYINFTANVDIYVQPMNTTWLFSTNESMKEIKVYRKWGNYWREIKFNQTWNKNVKYAVKFSRGKSYQLKIVGYKNNPYEDIKWGFEKVDPVWLGVKEVEFKEMGFDKLDAVSRTDEPKVVLYKWNREAKMEVKLPVTKKPQTKISTKHIRQDYEDTIVNLYNVSNGFEFEVILKKRPKTNKLTFDINSTDLEFYYQPPLDEEVNCSLERCVACNATHCWDENNTITRHRPENVVGSYAVYHKSKANNQYKTGKLFHIYRPKITDANNNSIWGELNITNGAMTITIDYDWLSKAKYPVTVDPTIGYTSIGGSINSLFTDVAYGVAVNTQVSSDGNIDEVCFYGRGVFNPSAKGFVTDSNKNILTNGVTGSITVGSAYAWYCMTYSTNPTVISGNDYYPFIIFSIQFSAQVVYDSETNAGLNDNTNSFSSPTDPTDAQSNNYKFSLYANYTASAADSTPPTYSNVGDNSSGSVTEGDIVKVYTYWTDADSNLDVGEVYLNNTGIMTLYQTCDLSGAKSGWCNATIDTSGYGGKTLCWKQYANDTEGNLNNTMGDTENCFSVVAADTSPPTFSNWQQDPPDINSSTMGKLHINVTITDDSGVNASSVKFYHWINDSQYPDQPWQFINGTAQSFEREHMMTNTSSVFNITLHTYAYNPSVFNVDPEVMYSATKYNYTLSTNNKALKVRFYNMSTNPNTTYVLKARLYRNSGDLLIYYCNSSYMSGKVYNSDYCVPITTLTSQAGTYYQNVYFYGDENSLLDGVKITPTGYIVFYSMTGSDWEVEYANIDSNSVETTTSGGTVWSNQNFTPDVWLIQINGNGLTTFGYKVYACDTLDNCGNSSIQEDSYAIANLPPSPAPKIITPENATYSGTFNITWEPCKDPNNDPFNYSLYLYYANGTLADTLADNNIPEGTEYYTFNSANYPDGQYYLIANATDSEGNTNFYILPYYFTIDNNGPTYSNNSTNSTIAGTYIMHSLFWHDDIYLSGYIFSFHNGSNITSCIGTLNCSGLDSTECQACSQCSYTPASCSGTPKACSEYTNQEDCELCGCTWSAGEGGIMYFVKNDSQVSYKNTGDYVVWTKLEENFEEGTYLFLFSGMTYTGSCTGYTWLRFVIDGNIIVNEITESSSGWSRGAGVYVTNLNNGIHNATIEYKSTSSWCTAYAKEGRIVAIKISNDPDKLQYDLDNGDAGTKENWVPAASVTITPQSQGKYLILASGSGIAVGHRLNISGNIYATQTYDVDTISFSSMYFAIAIKTLSSETKIELQENRKNIWYSHSYYGNLVVLRLDEQFDYDYTDDSTSRQQEDEGGTFGVKDAWLTFSPSSTANYTYIASTIVSNNTPSVKWELDGVDSAQTTWNPSDTTNWASEGYINIKEISSQTILKEKCDEIHKDVAFIILKPSGGSGSGSCTGIPKACSEHDCQTNCAVCGCTWTPEFCSNSGSCSACSSESECDNCAAAGCSWSSQEFVNDTWTSFPNGGTDDWSNVTKFVNTTVGALIKWKVYANDTSDHWTVSDTYTYYTTSAGVPDINISIWDGTNWIPYTNDVSMEFRCSPTQTQCEPEYQNAAGSQCIMLICNNGTGDGSSVDIKISDTCSGITLKADNDFTYADALSLTTSYQQIHGALAVGECQQLCWWADYNNPSVPCPEIRPYVRING